MASFYPYLVSSLPMLHFGGRPPQSGARLIDMCRGLIPDADISIIEALQAGSAAPAHPTLRRWREADRMLRNELVRARASRRKIDPARYLQGEGSFDFSASHAALSAYRNPSVLEAERMLDAFRWQALDELAVGHFFDLDFLIVYAAKLSILERWETVGRAEKAALLERALTDQRGAA